MGSPSKVETATDGDTSSGDIPPSNSNIFSDGERSSLITALVSTKPRVGIKSADRLMKHTEENVMKQQALDKKQGVDKSPKSGRSSQSKPKSSADAKADKEDQKNTVPKGRKRNIDSGVEKDKSSLERLVKIQVPSTLKKQLVDDWDSVTQQDKLVKLPRAPNVDDILIKYLEYRSKKDGIMTDSIGEILKGIRC